ncbi:uncharacterized protein PV09_06483 [Verruconis gallopava]|uniref:HTH La-type RNA-binding domain-containing protein n=1 Tax=Verruconis gallopava TaxID=253628 RepID=A0A0D1YNR1_9PEZI|nr:uncharacterized protein PV09_06483 [Verruconis gallopava]KIW02342.1 hypothetical protein PV09_06483 [Verruconis gallopava]
MSADTEAASANPTTVEHKTEESKAPESSETEEKSNDPENGASANDKKKNNSAGRELDDKYSKNRSDNSRSKRNGSSRANGNEHHHHRRAKFDRANIKSRYDDQEKTDDPVLIRKQVEFYFSDANLLQDKFLFNQIGGSENRPVDIKLIASFKRMLRFEPYSAIVAALTESTVLEVIDADKPNDAKVRRRTPLPGNIGKTHAEVKANYNSESMKRSIYAKGFGPETAKTQLEIEDFFAPYMATSVRLRRADDGSFKGSVFVEFENEESMKQFLELEEKPEWQGKKLEIKSKVEYSKEKDKLLNEGKIRRNDLEGHDDRRGNGHRGGRNGHRGGRRFNERRGRNHSRSRSRSPGRLERKNWRDLADEEDKERASKQQDLEDTDVPKVTGSTEDNGEATTNDKKRAREDDDNAEGAETKKAKANND